MARRPLLVGAHLLSRRPLLVGDDDGVSVGRSVGIFVGSSKGFAAFAASSSTPGSFESSISLSSSSPPTETAPKLLSLRLVGDGVGTVVTPFLVGAADGAAEYVGNAVGPSVGDRYVSAVSPST